MIEHNIKYNINISIEGYIEQAKAEIDATYESDTRPTFEELVNMLDIKLQHTTNEERKHIDIPNDEPNFNMKREDIIVP